MHECTVHERLSQMLRLNKNKKKKKGKTRKKKRTATFSTIQTGTIYLAIQSREQGLLLFLLMYIMLWALGPITLLVQHTYTCTALYLYRTLMLPI